MMREEFIELTGFEPTADEYREIEDEYIAADIDKEIFCRQWVENKGIQRLSRLRVVRMSDLAQSVERLSERIDEMNADFYKETKRRDTKIEELRELIRLEQEEGEAWRKKYLDLKSRISEVLGKLEEDLEEVS